MALVAPSILSADFACLADGLAVVRDAGVTRLHVDVTDGHFVPDITAGQPVLASLRRATDLLLDVHLLMERPERYIAEFVKAGADRLTVHAEATSQLHRVIASVKACGVEVGVALNPATRVGSIADVASELDSLTLVSPTPGKVREACRLRQESGGRFAVEVEDHEGGSEIEEYARAGADILVVGGAIFNRDDPRAALKEMIRRAGNSPQGSLWTRLSVS